MRHCGCSETMYRPNMVILVKDDVPTNTNIASGKSNYRLTHVSSFMDLGIEVLPWWEDKGLCEGKMWLYLMGYQVGQLKMNQTT